MKTLCFTGHRPNKLGGFYGEKAELIKRNLGDHIHDILKRACSVGITNIITGGALGVDQMAAEAVIAYNEVVMAYNSVIQQLNLVVARPFPSFSKKWPSHAQEHFQEICKNADEIIDVSPDPYSIEKMDIRNKWMVDHSDVVIAIWNGGPSGTGNCVKYAREKFKPILVVNPYTHDEKWNIPSQKRW